MANNFKKAVMATPEVANGYKDGLQALGNHSGKIEVADNRKINGSLDIDSSTVSRYPAAPRWDYAFDYDGKVYYVEVHSANTSDVASVLEKLQWLKRWLRDKAPAIGSLPKGNPAYCRLQSEKGALLSSSKEYKRAAEKGIIPKPMLRIK